MDLEERLEHSKQLINRRKFTEAQVWCTQTHRDFPDSLEALKQLYLVLLLLDQPKAAATLLQLSGVDIPDVDWGDMKRDEAFFYIRHDKLEKAEQLLLHIEKLHKGDANRLGCLLGAKALILAARRDFTGALWNHQRAHDHITDPQWRYNNICHWQRTAYRAGKYVLMVRLWWRVIRGAPGYGTWKHPLGALVPGAKIR